jgi:acyl carrier protein
MTEPEPTPRAAGRRELLCALFAEALGIDRAGPDDDFFELGGQSVQALVLAARIRAELGLEVPVAVLFDAPTAAELDRVLDGG